MPSRWSAATVICAPFTGTIHFFASDDYSRRDHNLLWAAICRLRRKLNKAYMPQAFSPFTSGSWSAWQATALMVASVLGYFELPPPTRSEGALSTAARQM
jgi:hypothetical protein